MLHTLYLDILFQVILCAVTEQDPEEISIQELIPILEAAVVNPAYRNMVRLKRALISEPSLQVHGMFEKSISEPSLQKRSKFEDSTEQY